VPKRISDDMAAAIGKATAAASGAPKKKAGG
jgi:hypothetical protein